MESNEDAQLFSRLHFPVLLQQHVLVDVKSVWAVVLLPPILAQG